VNELVIRFTGIEAQGTVGGIQATGNSQGTGADNGAIFQASAFNLQVKELNLTLTNGAGQTLPVRAPDPAANLNAPITQSTAKAAGA
jgi:hypothetical protein